MTRLLCALALILTPISAQAMSTGIYDLVLPARAADTEMTGFFSYDAALESTNPFVDWSFTYVYPVAIVGAEWSTEDTGYWYQTAQTLYVVNPENLSLTFQLCFPICGEFPNTWGMNVYDNDALRRYGAGGTFMLREVETSAAVSTLSVTEPTTGLLLGMGMLLIILTSFVVTHAKARLKPDHFIE